MVYTKRGRSDLYGATKLHGVHTRRVININQLLHNGMPHAINMSLHIANGAVITINTGKKTKSPQPTYYSVAASSSFTEM